MQTARTSSFRRLVRFTALAAVLVPFFVLGGWLDPLYTGPQGITNLSRGVAARYDPKIAVFDPYKLPKLAPKDVGSVTAEPARAEPRAARQRAERIRRTADAIRAECRHAADGDWSQW